MRWENPKLAANLRVTSTGKKGQPPAVIRDALNGEPAPVGEAAVGWRIGVWWRDDACFYKGTVERFSSESGKLLDTLTIGFTFARKLISYWQSNIDSFAALQLHAGLTRLAAV